MRTRCGWSGQDLPFGGGSGDYESEDGETARQDDAPDRQWETLMRKCAELFRAAFGEACLYGRYALNSFIIFVPGREPFEVAKKAERLFRLLRQGFKNGESLAAQAVLSGEAEPCSATDSAKADSDDVLHAAFGIAPHPFLAFRQADGL